MGHLKKTYGFNDVRLYLRHHGNLVGQKLSISFNDLVSQFFFWLGPIPPIPSPGIPKFTIKINKMLVYR